MVIDQKELLDDAKESLERLEEHPTNEDTPKAFFMALEELRLAVMELERDMGRIL